MYPLSSEWCDMDFEYIVVKCIVVITSMSIFSVIVFGWTAQDLTDESWYGPRAMSQYDVTRLQWEKQRNNYISCWKTNLNIIAQARFFNRTTLCRNIQWQYPDKMYMKTTINIYKAIKKLLRRHGKTIFRKLRKDTIQLKRIWRREKERGTNKE